MPPDRQELARPFVDPPATAISYDEGRSFDDVLTGPCQTTNALMHGESEFLAFTEPRGRSDGSAGIYRWVANEP